MRGSRVPPTGGRQHVNARAGEPGEETTRLPFPFPRRRRAEPDTRGVDRQGALDAGQLDSATDGAVDPHVAVAAPCPAVALAAEVDAAIFALVPLAVAMLPVNSLVYVLDGCLVGAGDFKYLAGEGRGP